jgi:predicted DNA-binding transcriptional regulator YafY
MFKLSRMRKLAAAGEQFSRRNASWHDIIPADPQPKNPIILKLLFSPQSRVKTEDFFEPSQLHLRDDGCIEVNLTLDEDEWLYSWLLSFTDDVEVVGPESIRRRYLEKIIKIQKKYLT